MEENGKKKDALSTVPSNSLAKVNRSLQITDRLIAKSHTRQFELERVHFESVRIGNQEWMAKNLDVAYFRNGDPIPEIKGFQEWEDAGENGQPGWCYFDNDPANGKHSGKLYNRHAINDTRGLVPKGWSIPELYKDWYPLVEQKFPKSTYAMHFSGDGPYDYCVLKVPDDVFLDDYNDVHLEKGLADFGLPIELIGSRLSNGVFSKGYARWWFHRKNGNSGCFLIDTDGKNKYLESDSGDGYALLCVREAAGDE